MLDGIRGPRMSQDEDKTYPSLLIMSSSPASLTDDTVGHMVKEARKQSGQEGCEKRGSKLRNTFKKFGCMGKRRSYPGEGEG